MYTAIYSLVEAIPEGRMATYGQVAALAGYPGRARQVGYALAALPERLEAVQRELAVAYDRWAELEELKEGAAAKG